jgi:minimal CRISPR polymerase domain
MSLASTIFCFYDGDNIGQIFNVAYLANDERTVVFTSDQISKIHRSIANVFFPIQQGGDEGIILCPFDKVGACASFIKTTWESRGLCVSLGFGNTLSEAFSACQQEKKSKNIRPENVFSVSNKIRTDK